jgi:hypothetical protein
MVTGRVTAVRGRQFLSGATVTVLSGSARSSGFSNQEGEYLVRDVEPGPATLLVSHPDYATSHVEVTVERTARADRPFELPEVDLKEAAVVRGVVVDRQGEPVAGARVADGVAPAYLPAGAVPAGMAMTNASGTFEIRGLTPGRHTIEAYAPGVGRGHVEEIEVSSGRPIEGVRIELSGETSDVEPMAGATVAITLGELSSEDEEEGESEPPALAVVHVADGSDAQSSGIHVGDRLLRVDGVTPASLDDARTRLSGAPGTNVLVDLDRNGQAVSLRLLRESVTR